MSTAHFWQTLALILGSNFRSMSVDVATSQDYLSSALNATKYLNDQYYNTSTGLWSNYWWNSANVMTTLADLAQIDTSYLATAESYFEQTHLLAPNEQGSKDWLDAYYDDDGWWALGWIAAYDVTGNTTYLSTAESIFQGMEKGYNATCGGHWWNTGTDNVKQANTAIGNELYLSVAAHLANRNTTHATYYSTWAQTEWTWFEASGLINVKNTINDGLNLTTCQNNGAPSYTYNQGVILGALVELNTYNKNATLLTAASDIANAAIAHLTDANGILTEPGYPSALDATGAQFKGVFARNLQKLQGVKPDQAYVTFLQNNANAIWSEDNQGGGLGPFWQGPYQTPNAASQSSALDCLVAAAAVS